MTLGMAFCTGRSGHQNISQMNPIKPDGTKDTQENEQGNS